MYVQKKEEIAELENSAGGVSSVLFEKHDFRLNRGTMLEILARRLDFAVCTFIFKWDVSKSHFFCLYDNRILFDILLFSF